MCMLPLPCTSSCLNVFISDHQYHVMFPLVCLSICFTQSIFGDLTIIAFNQNMPSSFYLDNSIVAHRNALFPHVFVNIQNIKDHKKIFSHIKSSVNMFIKYYYYTIKRRAAIVTREMLYSVLYSYHIILYHTRYNQSILMERKKHI